MTLFPEVAKTAQTEIDAIIGQDRLPTFDDSKHLPYVEALVKEVLRWNSVVPTGKGIYLTSSHSNLTKN
jgi:cytochrome P450